MKVEHRLFRQAGRTLQWVLVSWEGPPEGKVFVADCAGRRLADLDLGYVDHATAGPAIQGNATLEVRYIPATGTNIREQSVSLLQFQKEAISVLWDHKSMELASAPLVPMDTADLYRWRFLDGGLRVAVTGTRTTGTIKDMRRGIIIGRNKALPAESFCFDAKRGVFTGCR
ncbi:hypothetical protein [Phenylobacterium sp.]|uniref:hypothetical protein n=1 Tax=Phenylobacterium sp. TaxID=1871053 RepID=UPI00374D16DC